MFMQAVLEAPQPGVAGTERTSCAFDLVEGLPAEEVHRRALIARRAFAGSYRALCFWLLDVEKRQLYKRFGCSSTFHYAESGLELAPHTIWELLRTSKALENFPKLAQACGEGLLAPSKAREISRVAAPETEEYWLKVGTGSSYREVERLVAMTPKGGLPRTGPEAVRPRNNREAEKGTEPQCGGTESPPAEPAPACRVYGAGSVQADRLAIIHRQK